MRLIPLALAGLLLAGCSSSAPTAAEPIVHVTATPGTWASGTALHGVVTIAAGTTVTLAPGAEITAYKGAKLVVLGRLLAPSGATIAGKGWSGLVIEAGGTATLSGVTLDGADTAVSTLASAGPTTVSHGRIVNTNNPLIVASGTTLTLDDVSVRKAHGASAVNGVLIARKLSYDKSGNPGLVFTGADAVLQMSDSDLYGDGQYDGDMITTSNARSVTISDTAVHGAHCAFHLVGVGKLDLDRLSIHDNAYGFMAYGSDPQQVHHITDTDVFKNRDYGLLESTGTVQGKVLVDGGYWGDNGSSVLASLTQITGQIVRTDPATAPR